MAKKIKMDASTVKCQKLLDSLNSYHKIYTEDEQANED